MVCKIFSTLPEALAYDKQITELEGYRGKTGRWCKPIPLTSGDFAVISADGQGVEILDSHILIW